MCVRLREVFCRNSHSPECHRKPLRSVSGAWEGSAGLLRHRRVEEQVSGVTSLKNRSIVAVRKQLTVGKNHSRSASRHTHANKHTPSGKTHTHTPLFLLYLIRPQHCLRKKWVKKNEWKISLSHQLAPVSLLSRSKPGYAQAASFPITFFLIKWTRNLMGVWLWRYRWKFGWNYVSSALVFKDFRARLCETRFKENDVWGNSLLSCSMPSCLICKVLRENNVELFSFFLLVIWA